MSGTQRERKQICFLTLLRVRHKDIMSSVVVFARAVVATDGLVHYLMVSVAERSEESEVRVGTQGLEDINDTSAMRRLHDCWGISSDHNMSVSQCLHPAAQNSIPLRP